MMSSIWNTYCNTNFVKSLQRAHVTVDFTEREEILASDVTTVDFTKRPSSEEILASVDINDVYDTLQNCFQIHAASIGDRVILKASEFGVNSTRRRILLLMVNEYNGDEQTESKIFNVAHEVNSEFKTNKELFRKNYRLDEKTVTRVTVTFIWFDTHSDYIEYAHRN